MKCKISLGVPLLLIWGASRAFCEIYFDNGTPHVKLGGKGILSGKTDSSRDERPYSSFTGINYAEVPERFSEAKLSEANWDGVKQAIQLGNLCPQATLLATGMYFGSEDCLNLNVYIPASKAPGTGFPVMVFIHGGGFMYGFGGSYGPQFFMDEEVILVTINYRLGVFGFLSTGDGVVPGNNGLKDLVVGLNWVQKYIKDFGGDPGKVTIFGESAGAAAVHYLVLSKKANGLFHGAISQSGAANEAWAYHPNSKEFAVELATYMNCPATTSDAILACFKKAPMDELNKAQYLFRTSWPKNLACFYFGPTKESNISSSSSAESPLSPFISESPYALVANQNSPINQVPWMVGVTEDEGAPMYAGVVLYNHSLTNELDTTWNELASNAFLIDKFLSTKADKGKVAEKLRQFYFLSNPVSNHTRVNLTNIYSDVIANSGVLKSAMETAERGEKNQVYLYQYAYNAPMSIAGSSTTEEEKTKVGHADDLFLQFDLGIKLPGNKSLIEPKSQHYEFSKHFVKLWVSFATNGYPNYAWGASKTRDWSPISPKAVRGQSPPKWYRIQLAEPSMIDIDESTLQRMAFWDELYRNDLKQALM